MEVLSPREISDSIFFQPDTLITAELCDTVQRKRRLLPEHGLMFAVLEDAISCFQKYVSAGGRQGKRLFREAEEWILENDANWVFSFENVCESLGLDPRYIRRELLSWKERRIAGSREARFSRSQRSGIRGAARDHYRSYRSVR
jgi:hypothetical protein